MQPGEKINLDLLCGFGQSHSHICIFQDLL
jgi:hypothetical protein